MMSHASAYGGEFYELDEPVWNENRVWITEQERKWKDRHSGNKERHHANNQQQPPHTLQPNSIQNLVCSFHVFVVFLL